jgi:hypothetical protein
MTTKTAKGVSVEPNGAAHDVQTPAERVTQAKATQALFEQRKAEYEYAAKPKTSTPVVQTPVDEDTLIAEQTTVDTDAAQAGDEVEQLRAEVKAGRERIKAVQAKANHSNVSRLDREVAQQEQHTNKVLPYLVGGMAKRRVAAGQPADEAITAVLGICERLMREALATGASEENEHETES